MVATGSPLMGDDAAGLIAGRRLQAELGGCLLVCELGVENCIGLIAEKKPQAVLVIDASPSLSPGEVCLARVEELQDWLPGTHSVPPRLLPSLLGTRVWYLLLGVARVEPGIGVTKEAVRAVEKAVEAVERLAGCTARSHSGAEQCLSTLSQRLACRSSTRRAPQ